MAQTRVARASSSAQSWAANRQELMRKAEERREQAAQGRLTEEHTFQPVVPRRSRRPSSKLASGINQVRTMITPRAPTVSTATQTDAEVSTARAASTRPRRPRSSSPGSGRLERRSLGRPTVSLAQRSANTASFTPMSVQLQKWVTPLGLQKDAQSLAALALAVVGNPVAMADGISGPSIAASDSPEHAGSAACAREEAADSTVLTCTPLRRFVHGRRTFQNSIAARSRKTFRRSTGLAK